jgi:ribosomal protein S18 acetylase RimI-like enzyme
VPDPSTDPLTFRAATLEPHDVPDALAFAQRAGVQGVYVANGLSTASAAAGGPELERDAREIVLLHGADALLGVVYFGTRGNLVALTEPGVSPEALGRVLFDGPDWRIALGPEPALARVARRDVTPPIVFREQLYYAVEERQAVEALAGLPTEVRPADRRDVDALVRAALDLNEADLHVAPWRVNRAWLRDSVRERVEEGRTFVVGPIGRPQVKLDLGSVGPAGAMIEGVYTFPAARGQGLAAALVARVASAEFERGRPLVCLHVDARNASARRAYEKAGLRVVDTCWLLLRG